MENYENPYGNEIKEYRLKYSSPVMNEIEKYVKKQIKRVNLNSTAIIQ